jgi:biopolymer transport protein ExbB
MLKSQFTRIVRGLLLASLLAGTVWWGYAQAQESAIQSPSAPLTAAQVHSKKAQQEVGARFSSGWGQKLKDGGTTAIVQIAVSVFGAMFIFERFWNLRRNKIVPRGLTQKARELWETGNFAELEKIDTQQNSTLGRVIAWTARHRDASYADVSIGAGEIISQEMEEHHQRAYPMGVIATLEPLLGLLGMILGMIETFEVVALAGALGNPAQLAGGISEALVTTGLGLAVAIPFLALFHYFKSRTNMYSSQLEKEMTGLLSEWFLIKRAS